MTEKIAISLHEITLKGKNRKHFERKLLENLELALSVLGKVEIKKEEQRYFVGCDDLDRAEKLAAEVFGVAHVIRFKAYPRELNALADAAIERIKAIAPANFRVLTRRLDKKFELTSLDMDRQLGALVHENTGIPVKLRQPAHTIVVLVTKEFFWLGTSRTQGGGGLPVGTAGRVACLLSGGFDSAVAAYRMMKRGCHVDFVHFHSHPLVDKTTIEKAEDLVEVLTRYQYTSRLHLVPLAEIQMQIRNECPDPLRVILYRRFMYRLAEAVGRRNRCRALVTGEAIGQVASQTLANLAATDVVARMPVLRPLIGSDKQEIIDQATKIGTHDISILPDQDACQLFLPDSPVTHCSAAECEEAEKALDVDGLIRDAIHRTESLKSRYPEV